MTTNRLAKSGQEQPVMTLERARMFARWAVEGGHREQAEAWRKTVAELEAQDRPLLSGKMQAAGE